MRFYTEYLTFKTAKQREYINITPQVESALRKSEQQNKFQADIIKSSSQAVGVGYPDGSLGMVNTAFEQLVDYLLHVSYSLDWTDCHAVIHRHDNCAVI